MRLVIDTSILISALLKDSITREILLFSPNDKHFEALKGITVWKTTDVLSYLTKNKKK